MTSSTDQIIQEVLACTSQVPDRLDHAATALTLIKALPIPLIQRQDVLCSSATFDSNRRAAVYYFVLNDALGKSETVVLLLEFKERQRDTSAFEFCLSLQCASAKDGLNKAYAYSRHIPLKDSSDFKNEVLPKAISELLADLEQVIPKHPLVFSSESLSAITAHLQLTSDRLP